MIDAESRFSESTLRAGSSRPGAGTRSLLALVSIAVAATLVFAANASAAYVHPSATAEFGSDGTSSTNFSSLNTLAYQQATDRLYALDTSGLIHGFSHPSAAVFTPLGGGFPISYPGVGFNDSDITVAQTGPNAGNIYGTKDANNAEGFNSSGVALPITLEGNGEVCGLSVDSAGNIWGARYSGALAIMWTPAGGPFAESFSTSANAGNPCKIQVDQSNDHVFVSGWGGSTVTEYTSAGSVVRNYASQPSSNNRVAINATRHVAYIGGPNNTKINAYDTTTGALLETIEPGGSIKGLAVDDATDTLFVSTGGGNNKIKVMPGVGAPKATTNDPTANTTVAGIADPDGEGPIVSCKFEYALASSSTFTGEQACDQALPINSATPVSATLPGLEGEIEYKYRLVVANATPGAVGRGAEKSLTPHNVKGLATEAATAVTRSSAQLNASFEGDGTATTYYFEWGTGQTPPLTNKSSVGNAGSPTFPPKTDIPFTATDLKPDTTYYFRVVAENTTGKSPAKVLSFKTLPAIQSLTTDAATDLTPHSATLNASYVGDGDATTYFYEYGKTTAYTAGKTTPVVVSGTGPASLPVGVSDLDLETLYHYRVVAKNSLGETKGADQSFTTAPAVAQVHTLAATDLSQESVTLHGDFTGNGEPTDYFFEWGPSTDYGNVTATPPGESAGSPTGLKEVSTILTDFEGFTTYHYRLVASNSLGVTKGADMTFTTEPAPLPEIDDSTASGVRPTGVTLSATINPNRWMTVYTFEYGPTTDYGSSTPIGDPLDGHGNEPIPVSEVVNGLTPGTIYHFRTVATNFSGTTHTADQTFITPDVPRFESSSAKATGTRSAQLDASLVPNASATSVRFEYGTGGGYGSITAPQAVGDGLLAQSVRADLGGLEPGTTYHVRAVAQNGIGTTNGSDMTFTTQPEPVTTVPQPTKCKKGFVKRKGKCVKKKKKKKKPNKKRGQNGKGNRNG
ncbi:MAG TPA: hypothetical protein VIT85_03570 [Solirubrobacterales bacterium]